MTVYDVDAVCTHDQLVAEVHSPEALRQLLPPSANGDSHAIRALAYSDVVRALARRMPPIREDDLDDPTELQNAVVLGTLKRLHFAAITTAAEGDVHWAKYKQYQDEFESEINGISPSVSGGSEGGAFSFSLERR